MQHPCQSLLVQRGYVYFQRISLHVRHVIKQIAQGLHDQPSFQIRIMPPNIYLFRIFYHPVLILDLTILDSKRTNKYS